MSKVDKSGSWMTASYGDGWVYGRLHKAIEKGCKMLGPIIVDSIKSKLEGPRTGTRYWIQIKPTPFLQLGVNAFKQFRLGTRLHRASRQGEFPAKRYGFLQDSIDWYYFSNQNETFEWKERVKYSSKSRGKMKKFSRAQQVHHLVIGSALDHGIDPVTGKHVNAATIDNKRPFLGKAILAEQTTIKQVFYGTFKGKA